MALQRLHISTEEYFGLPYASNSGIKEAHKILQTGDFQEQARSEAYYFGSALDNLLTDPELVHTLDMPDAKRRQLLPMANAVLNNDTYKAFFTKDRGREDQCVFVDMEFPLLTDGMQITIPVKCKYDWFNPKPYINFGGDLKTTDAKTQTAFLSAAKWFEYDQQAAWYMDITGTNRFVIIAVSKINCQVFTLAIKRGDKHYESGKVKYLRRSSSWFKLNGSAA